MSVLAVAILLACLAVGLNAQGVVFFQDSTISGATVTFTGNASSSTLLLERVVLNAVTDIKVNTFNNITVNNVGASANSSLWQAGAHIYATNGNNNIFVDSTTFYCTATGNGSIELQANGGPSYVTNSVFNFTTGTGINTPDVTLFGLHVSTSTITTGRNMLTAFVASWVTNSTITAGIVGVQASVLENVNFFSYAGTTAASAVPYFFFDATYSHGNPILTNNLNGLSGLGLPSSFNRGNYIIGGTYDFSPYTFTGACGQGFTFSSNSSSLNTIQSGIVTIKWPSSCATTQLQFSAASPTTFSVPAATVKGTTDTTVNGNVNAYGPTTNHFNSLGNNCLRVTGTTSLDFSGQTVTGSGSVFTNGASEFNFLPVADAFTSSAYARFCGGQDKLVARPTSTTVGGVSFTNKLSFVLTTTFTNVFNAQPTKFSGQAWTVTAAAFTLSNGGSTGIVVTPLSSTAAAGTLTSTYQIDATTSCDGTISVLYYGAFTSHSNVLLGNPNHGLPGRQASLIYASCLAKQFCF